MTVELGEDDLKNRWTARWGISPSDPMGIMMRRIDKGQGGNRVVTRTFSVFQPAFRTALVLFVERLRASAQQSWRQV